MCSFENVLVRDLWDQSKTYSCETKLYRYIINKRICHRDVIHEIMAS